MAVRVDSAGAVPTPPAAPAPQTPPAQVAGAISLQDLARDLKAKSTTSTTRARPTTTTTAAPAAKRAATTTTAPARTTTTAASTSPPRAAPAPTITALSPLPSVVGAVVPPVTAVASAVTRTDSGIASWFNAPDATCAHRTLPFGTMLMVTRIHYGAVATCKVNDRGPTLETGRLIDLSLDTFEKLAAREAGLVDVRIEW